MFHCLRQDSKADGNNKADVYTVAVGLPCKAIVRNLQVYALDIDDYDMLIDMDLMSQMDWAVTNKDEKTTFSFRYPSKDTIIFND